MTPVSYHSNPLDLVQSSIDGVKLNVKTIILTYLILVGIIIATAIVITIGIFVFLPVGVVLAIAAFFAVATFSVLPQLRIALASAKHEEISVKEALTIDVNLAWKMIGTGLLATLAILGGFVLLIVPGILFTGWFLYTPYVVLVEGLGGVAAMRRSREISRGHLVESLGAYGLTLCAQLFVFIPIIGFLLVSIGSIIVIAVLPLRYYELTALNASGTEAESSVKVSGWNYVFIVVGLIIIGATSSLSINDYAQQLRQQNPNGAPVFKTSVIRSTR